MELGQNAETRIMSLMEKGAKLAFWISLDFEGSTNCYKITLDYRGSQLVLSTPPESEPLAEDPKDCICPVAWRIIKHHEIRQGYEYRGDYSRHWREVYEHINTPVPLWVSQQIYD